MDPVSLCRAGFDSGQTRPIEWRKDQLAALEDLIESERGALCSALADDLGKPPEEAWGSDLYPALKHCRYVRKSIAKWARPRRVSVPFPAQPAKAYTVADPLGVCLIIAPWNYPVLLSLTPLASVLGAGNTAVVKPSELAPATAEVLASCCDQYLDPGTVQLVPGGVAETEALLENRFDHILFTGSTRVGRLISATAAKTLTPVTLELGGKTPALVDATANIEMAAKRIAWGKFLNAGQSCIAPDYVMVDETVLDHFLEKLQTTITVFFGDDPQKSSDFGRIVDEQNVIRLSRLLDAVGREQILLGGTSDKEANYFAPTVVVDPDPQSALMTEEIFGPILPVLSTTSIKESLDFVGHRSKPLALYVFSDDSSVVEHVLANSSSGTVGVNNTMFQLAIPGLPFGGIGESGYGRYHGKPGFDRFSNIRSVVHKPGRPEIDVMYPPISRIKRAVLRQVLR